MSNPTQNFPIIGIGASAGGLDSFKHFLSAVPESSGMAYVLVQHLSPEHQSLLPEILSRSTSLPVHEITDQIQLRPDNVYIIPENKLLVLQDHVLKLMPRKPGEKNMPIDIFFTSLAKIHKSLAAGVVLSGTANDGTVGLKAIKDNGGITFAEDPEKAAWPGMPRSAVDAGVADFVLPVPEIVQKLLEINILYNKTKLWKDNKFPEGDEGAFRQILSLVRISSGVDFNYYKRPTLKRRVGRRMAINQTRTLKEYLGFLRENKGEQEALFQDMLIQVTSFFRDPKIFQELESTVLPAILRNKAGNEPLRIWVPGCATGEEAYSLCICLHRLLAGEVDGHNFQSRKIQIFASDISKTAIERARKGEYGANLLQDVPQDLLKNYFTKINSDYRINKNIRDCIVFTVHNFLTDPPFARLDLISCRNVFIYMESFLQRRALGNFQYALREQGYLALGTAETVGAAEDYFIPINKKEKIYIRRSGRGSFVPGRSPQLKEPKMQEVRPGTLTLESKPGFRKNAEKVLISRFTPPSVVVDQHMEVVHIHGNLEPFLSPPSGKPSFNLIKMAHEGLGFELRNGLLKAKSSRETERKEDISLVLGGERILVSLEIVPLKDTTDTYYLIIFHKRPPNISRWDDLWKRLGHLWTKEGEKQLRQRNISLERELAQVREDMSGISEDQEAFNEELQSANEELLSSNEEMQSLNEELETSKEELQSTNEELVIINHELIDKQEQLNDSLDYTENIVATLREPMLVLDKKFNILTANASFCKKFSLLEDKVLGRSLYNVLDGQWDIPPLRNLLEKLLPKQEAIHDFKMVIKLDNVPRTLLLNAREIEDSKKGDGSILLAMEDVTERETIMQKYRETISELKKSNEQLDNFVHIASHDLQEPLRKIRTFSDRLQEKLGDGLQAGTKTYLEKIEFSATKMAGLIKDLLTYSRATDPDQLFESTDLNELLPTILLDFETLIEEKGAIVNMDKMPVLEAVPAQMGQVFQNLIGNGLKFSKADVPTRINITSRKLEHIEVEEISALLPKLEYVEIMVKDNGIGFDEKHLEKIFTMFQRLHNQREYPGTGVGLALVKRIVENHHGKIFARAKEGEGAEFHVILPVKQAEKK